jgi:predicted transcriptional regulator
MLQNIFLRKKPIDLLVTLLYLKPNKRYISEIYRQTNCTYNHITKLLTQYEASGLISCSKSGQKKIISLTPFGEKLAKQFVSLRSVICDLEVTDNT